MKFFKLVVENLIVVEDFRFHFDTNQTNKMKTFKNLLNDVKQKPVRFVVRSNPISIDDYPINFERPSIDFSKL